MKTSASRDATPRANLVPTAREMRRDAAFAWGAYGFLYGMLAALFLMLGLTDASGSDAMAWLVGTCNGVGGLLAGASITCAALVLRLVWRGI